MKISKKLLAAVIGGSAMNLIATAPIAQAEVSASLSIASSYHWRGMELGSGTPAVSGDLVLSGSGFYAGMWASSGDTAAGSEYDLFGGYEFSAGDFTGGFSVVSYVYPTAEVRNTDGSPGDFMELILNFGYGPFSINYHDNVAGDTGGYAFDEDYRYLKAALTFEKFAIAIGAHDEGDVPAVTGNLVHLDLSYNYNDNLSFTLSTVLESDEGDADIPEYSDSEPFFVVSYSVPIE